MDEMTFSYVSECNTQQCLHYYIIIVKRFMVGNQYRYDENWLKVHRDINLANKPKYHEQKKKDKILTRRSKKKEKTMMCYILCSFVYDNDAIGVKRTETKMSIIQISNETYV